MSLLGLDMGTSACKAASFDEHGSILATASREYAASIPAPGRMEMDPERFWNAAVEVIREVASRTPCPVEALAISSQGETFIPMDSAGNAVCPAIMNADNRAVAQVAIFEEAIGMKGVYGITGCVLHPMYALMKILWLKENAPDFYGRADKFLSVGDYILMRMGVELYTDYSLASRTMAFDVNRRQWSDELLSIAGIETDRLPEPVPSGTVAGRLSPPMAQTLGLPVGTVVAVGGHDQPCGALGAGVIDPGDAADSAGSYECLAVASARPILDGQALSYSLNSYCHVVPDRYVTLAFFPAGIVLRWFRDEFCQLESAEALRSGVDVYDMLTARLPDGPSGICLTPHFIGSGNPTWNPSATGVAVGLTPGSGRHHLFKAILEGVACELAINIEVLESLTGGIGMLRTTGGGAKSDYWLQLRADLTGRRTARMRNGESVCLGAAILAGMASGRYSDASQGVRSAVSIGRVYEPDPSVGTDYSDQMLRYRRIYPALHEYRVY